MENMKGTERREPGSAISLFPGWDASKAMANKGRMAVVKKTIRRTKRLVSHDKKEK